MPNDSSNADFHLFIDTMTKQNSQLAVVYRNVERLLSLCEQLARDSDNTNDEVLKIQERIAQIREDLKEHRNPQLPSESQVIKLPTIEPAGDSACVRVLFKILDNRILSIILGGCVLVGIVIIGAMFGVHVDLSWMTSWLVPSKP